MAQAIQNLRAKKIHVGPQDAGRHMSLADFEEAIGQEGYIYELNKGVIELWGVPPVDHLMRMTAVRDPLIFYKESNPEIIHAVGGAADIKILLEAEQSERHPEIAVYCSSMPDTDEIWSIWVPTIVVEIISEGSIKRDYQDKPAEYLAVGVQEYWIIDGFKNQMTVLTRFRGMWKERIIKPSQKYSTRHLPGFTLDLKRVLSAGK